MDVPYAEIFVALLLAYMVYSVWARLDGRYPIVAALVLLVVTAVVDAAGDASTANTLAEYVFFLLAAGVVLLVIEQVRARPAPAATAPSGSPTTEGVAPETAQQREGSSEQPFERLEEQPVSLVDRTGGEDQAHEQGRDREPEDGEGPPGEGRVKEDQGDRDRHRGGDDGEDKVPVERVDPREKPELDQG